MSLLSNAKKVPVTKTNNRSEADSETIELAVAYAKHEVTAKQVATVLGFPKTEGGASRAHGKMLHALISAVRTGIIK